MKAHYSPVRLSDDGRGGLSAVCEFTNEQWSRIEKAAGLHFTDTYRQEICVAVEVFAESVWWNTAPSPRQMRLNCKNLADSAARLSTLLHSSIGMHLLGQLIRKRPELGALADRIDILKLAAEEKHAALIKANKRGGRPANEAANDLIRALATLYLDVSRWVPRPSDIKKAIQGDSSEDMIGLVTAVAIELGDLLGPAHAMLLEPGSVGSRILRMKLLGP